MKLYIKHMVSARCRMTVRDELKKLGLHYVIVDLGEVSILEDMSAEQLQQFNTALRFYGLELMEDETGIICEKIKTLIVEMIHSKDELPKVNYSDYISEKLRYNYTYLSNLFSKVKGITIQHFILVNRIEKAKELLSYGELTLTEISYLLQFSSVAHLSRQFKKITGFTPTDFKHLKYNSRIAVEDLEDSAPQPLPFGLAV